MDRLGGNLGLELGNWVVVGWITYMQVVNRNTI